MAYRHRPEIDSIPAYKQGKPAPRTPGLSQQAADGLKLSSNENPYQPLKQVQAAIQAELGRVSRYPDMRGWAVAERLAAELGLSADNIQLGCGSTEVITQLVDLVAGPGDEVVYPWRSFEAYPIIVTAAGATSVQVPLTAEGRHDIDAMIAAVNERTRLVIVNNPNNPTATSVSRAEAQRLLEAVPADVVVLFDEAYFQFNQDPQAAAGLDFFRRFPNVVVAQTFSKAYGLAGLRIGYAFGPVPVIEGMRKVALPFGVSGLAQVAALASLDASEELRDRVWDIVAERERVIRRLAELGWVLPRAQANFFWLPCGQKTAQVAAAFEAAGLAVRVFDPEGIRVTIGLPAVNDQVLQVCAGLAERGLRL